MKKLTTGKIVALCMGDFARGIINGIVTTYLLTFFIPTNANTTLPRFFLNAALIMAVMMLLSMATVAVAEEKEPIVVTVFRGDPAAGVCAVWHPSAG